MSYEKHTWVNNVDSVDEDKMNHIENGIANAVEKTGDTMTGDLNMQGNSVKFGNNGNILFKEDGYGDKFRIIPDFGGTGANNKLIIQSTTGEAGTDPQNWQDLVYIHADTGLIELAGSIMCNNSAIYDAIRKKRNINGTKYGLTVGVGGNGSARMEYTDNNDTVLGSVEVRNNGVWNGLSNRRLPEVAYTAWSSSLSFKMTGGHALVMISKDDCVMLWVGGNPPNQSINTVRLYGNGIQVSFNASTQMVTLKYQDNHNFTGTAFIANG